MVGIFVDGLYSDRLTLKVMRDDPKTISAAIKSARQEYTLQQRFHLRTGRDYFAPQSSSGGPMEIDHITDSIEINALLAKRDTYLDLSIKRFQR